MAAAAASSSSSSLTALDTAKTQRYHFHVFLVAGIGSLAGAYGLFSISPVSKLLGRIYYSNPSSSPSPGTLPPNVSAAITAAALCGTLAGQLFFGWLGDRLGRKAAYGTALLLVAASSVALGLSFGRTASSVMATLCFFRLWLGFGVGGDIVLGAAIMAEYANSRRRGAFMAAVLAMQGPGTLAGAFVSMAASAAFGSGAHPAYAIDHARSTPARADLAWRIVLMAGAIPALVARYRLTALPETTRYTVLVEGCARQAALDMSRVLSIDHHHQPDLNLDQPGIRTAAYGLFSREFARRHGWHLLGTSVPWFMLSAALYSQSLLQRDIFAGMGWLPRPAAMSALEEVYKISRAQLLLALCSTLPGIWFTIGFIDVLGRVKIQLLGFFMMTAFMLGLAVPYSTLKGQPTSLVLYAFAFFFANFGPNLTTAILSAELFPARLRTTCFGISAAAGKAGAIVGAFGFLYASQSNIPGQQDHGYPNGIGVRTSLLILAGINAMGFFFTFLVPETKGRSLEEITGEISDHVNDVVADPRSM